MRQGAQAAGADNLKFIYQIVGADPGGKTAALYQFLNSTFFSTYFFIFFNLKYWRFTRKKV